MRRWLLLLLTFIGLLTWGLRAVPARADEIADFETARRAYDSQAYDHAAALFESMVGGEVPRIQNELLIVESRKYLGAAYLFIDRRADAEEQFRELLRQDPSYELDPIAFPEDVHQVFGVVRNRLEAQSAEAEAEREAAERRRREETMQRMLRQEGRIQRLEELAREEVVETESSRLIATIPFGIGQFQNEDTTGGRVFAISEATLALGSVATWATFQWAKNRALSDAVERESDKQRLERVADIMRPLNITLFSLLGAVVVIGITHAHLKFVPTRRRVRQRDLPEDLEVQEPPGTSVNLSIGPGRLDLQLAF